MNCQQFEVKRTRNGRDKFFSDCTKKRSEFLDPMLEKLFFHFLKNFNTWRWECWDQNFNLGLRSGNK
jgi:hypothetical protein